MTAFNWNGYETEEGLSYKLEVTVVPDPAAFLKQGVAERGGLPVKRWENEEGKRCNVLSNLVGRGKTLKGFCELGGRFYQVCTLHLMKALLPAQKSGLESFRAWAAPRSDAAGVTAMAEDLYSMLEQGQLEGFEDKKAALWAKVDQNARGSLAWLTGWEWREAQNGLCRLTLDLKTLLQTLREQEMRDLKHLASSVAKWEVVS